MSVSPNASQQAGAAASTPVRVADSSYAMGTSTSSMSSTPQNAGLKYPGMLFTPIFRKSVFVLL